MNKINFMVNTMIERRERRGDKITLLAVCPNSAAVLEAAVKTAKLNNCPVLFAATLNQVDRDGGYTGWTPKQFVDVIQSYAKDIGWNGALFPCLDHGGPWLKDRHTTSNLTLVETMHEVKLSITACLEGGYQLLHIDPTVDRSLSDGQIISIETVVARTVELIAYAESERKRLGIAPVAYEVGTEEVHGGLVDLENFAEFLHILRNELSSRNLEDAWPAFVVAQVGTNLHTTSFDSSAAERLSKITTPLNCLIKCHYSDWVAAPQDYPVAGVGGANVGPEFTSEEFNALHELSNKEEDLYRYRSNITPSRFMAVLERIIVESGRWKKWLHSEEADFPFSDLSESRRTWLLQTGARYAWTHPEVLDARMALYKNLSLVMDDPNAFVVNRIMRAMDRYVLTFHLFDANSYFS